MNKDLAADSADWRALFGVLGAALLLLYLSTCCPLFKEPAEDGFAADNASSLETDVLLDVALSENSRTIAIACL